MCISGPVNPFGPHPEERPQDASRRMATDRSVWGHPSRRRFAPPQDEVRSQAGRSQCGRRPSLSESIARAAADGLVEGLRVDVGREVVFELVDVLRQKLLAIGYLDLVLQRLCRWTAALEG